MPTAHAKGKKDGGKERRQEGWEGGEREREGKRERERGERGERERGERGERERERGEREREREREREYLFYTYLCGMKSTTLLTVLGVSRITRALFFPSSSGMGPTGTSSAPFPEMCSDSHSSKSL